MRTCLFFAALLVCGSVMAQQGTAISAWHYRVESNSYYHVKDGVPGSGVVFYSEQYGGNLLKEALLDEVGNFSMVTDQPFAPAFVLNAGAQNSTWKSGSGKIFFIEKEEFILMDMGTEMEGSVLSLHWNAATDPAKKISFEILKSYDGLSYFKVADINAYSTGLASDYVFTEAKGTAGTSYKINVNNGKEGTRYTSYPLAIKNNDVISVHPTITKSNINVVLLQDADTRYIITNTLGQPVSNGNLVKGINELSVREFPAGIYMVNVNGGVRNFSVKFVKE